MLSDKIDLTENRDFGGGISFRETFDRLFGDGRLYAYVFGKKKYENEYYSKIKIDIPDEMETRNQCQCCGEILAPWNLNFGLCKECSDRITGDFRKGLLKKCPWVKYDYHNEKDVLLKN